MAYGDTDFNIGLGNGLLPDGFKPLPNWISTSNQAQSVNVMSSICVISKLKDERKKVDIL